MHYSRILALFAASLTVAPTVVASPGFRFTPLQKEIHHDSGSSPSSSASHPSTTAAGSTKVTTGKTFIDGTGRGCGSVVTPKIARKVEKKFQKSRRPAKNARAGPVKFPVHFHVIATNRTAEGGWLSDETIAAQIDVLNEGFDLAGFDWELVNTTRILNPEWFSAGFHYEDEIEREIKLATRQGDAATLNVWTVDHDLLGYATFPWYYDATPELDGVVIHYGSVPGGSMSIYNKGHTLTHEVGHWVGLYHTFDGKSCDGPGDYVSDTPQQSKESRSCTPSDSCAHLPGSDPYTNFMDYSPDECLSEFTTGQIRRMREEVRTYRGVEDA
ncbi:metalloprotease [Coprinopsis cinerea AmutBmut pab1-1]|nr:metalloprotease [Coprinopsis cinerea AmutBmut pab1-1]KAG2016334.1 metalloprotease [Coprinopsis cinerea AmutBmut pab1-1]